MNTRTVWANLEVESLERTKDFYTRLGFKPNGSNTSPDLVSFLFGEEEFVIHFFVRQKIQQNMGVEMVIPQKGSEVMFTLAAIDNKEVEQWAKRIEAAGGILFQKAGNHNGYYGCGFSDPDGHKFNILSMQGM